MAKKKTGLNTADVGSLCIRCHTWFIATIKGKVLVRVPSCCPKCK